MGILVCVPLPTFRDPTSQSKISSLEIFPHPTWEVKGSGDCEFSYHISHMASEKWEVGLEQEFPFLKYPTLMMIPAHHARFLSRRGGRGSGEIIQFPSCHVCSVGLVFVIEVFL